MQPALAYPPLPYLEYEAIRERADAFLARYGWRGELPINIEKIVDVKMGLDIVTYDGLVRELEVHGFLTRDRTTVYVDPYTSDELRNRYRFTLAHEAGHYELHQDLYHAADFQTLTEWKSFINQLPEKGKSRYEFQADCFAGLVLAPMWALRSTLKEVKAAAWLKGYDPDPADEADRAYLIPRVARRLGVSGAVVEIRGRYDGLW